MHVLKQAKNIIILITLKSFFMNRNQTDKLNSFIKSLDVLTNNAASLSTIPQIATGRIALKATIDAIANAAGTGSTDLTGYAEDKRNKRQAVMDLLQKVTRAAAAYYNSVGNTAMLRKVDFVPSELNRQRDTDFYVTAKAMYQLILPDGLVIIGAGPSDLTDLNAANEQYFLALQEPKNQAELSKVANDSIDGLIAQGDAQRKSLDIYMLTFANERPALYALWKLSLSIDNTGGANPAVLVVPATANGSGAVTNIDYTGIALVPSTEIKIRNAGPATLYYGFSANSVSLQGQQNNSLSPGADVRITALAMGYDAVLARFLNLRNDEQVASGVEVSFYDMD
jgi:hypothetical protein